MFLDNKHLGRVSCFQAIPFLAVLCLLVYLPIPVRCQSLEGSSIAGIQFPGNTLSCVTCQPAFSSPACQQILNSIAKSSVDPISNSTLANCQCSSSFLSLYKSCVECFTETGQLGRVFGGSGNGSPPSKASLDAYCRNSAVVQATTIVMATKTATVAQTEVPTLEPMSELISSSSASKSMPSPMFLSSAVVVPMTAWLGAAALASLMAWP